MSVQLTLFVPVTVTLKLEWVPRSNFGYGKVETMLFSAAAQSFESEQALEVALELYRKPQAAKTSEQGN